MCVVLRHNGVTTGSSTPDKIVLFADTASSTGERSLFFLAVLANRQMKHKRETPMQRLIPSEGVCVAW